ncbi:hypothetical protein D3C81_1601210 [compost metagenome]
MDDLDAHAGIGQRHQHLLGFEWHRQQLAEPVGDPARVVPEIRLVEGQARFVGLLGMDGADDAPQRRQAFAEQFELAVDLVGRQQRHPGHDQAVITRAVGKDLEALPAARLDQQHAQLFHIAVDDIGQAAHVFGHGGLVRLRHLVATRDQADAERRAVAHAVAHHVHIARLEHAQRQAAIGKQYRVERKQRQRVQIRRGMRRMTSVWWM